MPNRQVTVRRWQVTFAFIALTFAYVIGLWALDRSQQIDRQGRAARLVEIHRADLQSCRSRHNLAVALLSENRALTIAYGASIRQAQRLKRLPGVSDHEFHVALSNARELVAHLQKAKRLAKASDCTKQPPPLSTPKQSDVIP